MLILREEKAKLQSSHRDSKRSQNQKRENDTMEMVKDDVKNEKIEDRFFVSEGTGWFRFSEIS